jgi:hypothetical protein
VTLDDMIAGNVGGIEKVHIADFLLKEVWWLKKARQNSAELLFPFNE